MSSRDGHEDASRADMNEDGRTIELNTIGLNFRHLDIFRLFLGEVCHGIHRKHDWSERLVLPGEW